MCKTSLFIPPIHDRYMIDIQNREHELNLSEHNNNYTLADFVLILQIRMSMEWKAISECV